MDINHVLKTHTYSQLYLINRGLKELYKTDEEKKAQENPFKEITKDNVSDYLKYLRDGGL